METILEQLSKILKNLESIGGIEQSAIVSRDGLLMNSSKDGAEAFGAMSAVSLGAAEHAFAELSKGVPEKVIIKNSECQMVLVGAGPKALLAVIAAPDAILGLVLVETETTAKKIKEILE